MLSTFIRSCPNHLKSSRCLLPFLSPNQQCQSTEGKKYHIPWTGHCWLGDRKGIQPVKNWVLVCWWWWFERSFARLIAPVVTTHHLHHPLLQWTPANPGLSGKSPLKRRERDFCLTGLSQKPMEIAGVRYLPFLTPIFGLVWFIVV